MSGFPVRNGDVVQLAVWSTISAPIVTLSGYLRTCEGELVTLQRTLGAGGDRAIRSTTFPVTEGEILHLTVAPASEGPSIGQTFARVQLLRGVGAISTVVATLAGGYVTFNAPITFPGVVKHSLEGPGNHRAITGSDPAANTEISETVPAGARWRLRSMRFALVTDATAANREVVLTLDNGTLAAYARIPSGANQAASLTHGYTFALHTQKIAPGVALAHALPLPDVILMPGSLIRTVTTNIQATDNYGAPTYIVEEWLELNQ